MSPLPPRLRWGLAVLAMACVFAAFWPSLSADWLTTWDDQENFLRNPHYRGLGASNLSWMFSNTMGHYMPLTWITLGADYELWGMNARGYHFTSVLIHAVNTALCFFLLLSLFRKIQVSNPWAALAAALLYGLHPLRVESVAWITERRDLVAGLFFIPAVTAYVNAVPDVPGEPLRPRNYGLSIALFACSLISKTIGLMLPLALLVLDVYPLRRLTRASWKRPLLEKIPYLALMGAGVVLTAITTAEAGSFRADVTYGAAQVLTQPFYKLALYASSVAVPLGLSPVYRYVAPTSLFELRFLLSGALVLGLSGAFWAFRRKAPALLAAWAGFALLLGPVLSPLQAGPHVTADRYTYLAGLVLAVLAAGGLAALPPARRALAAATSVAVLAGLGVLSWTYCRVWKNAETLWTHAIQRDPSSSDNYLNRGAARANQGKFPESIEDYTEALRLRPEQPMAMSNRGYARMRMGDFDGGLKDVDQALSWMPSYAPGYRVRGEIHQRQRKWREAEEDYTKAIEHQKVMVEAWTERGAVRSRLGKFKEAVEDSSTALLLYPENFQAYLNRGLARGELGDLNGAIADYTAALKVNATLAEAWGGLGMCYALQNRWEDAAMSFERALAVARPGWPFRADTERRLDDARRRLRSR
jgi:protein O-mannosyl-transferase